MNDLIFVKWKCLITKSVDDSVITAWFECTVPMYEQLHRVINKPLELSIELNWESIELKCNINTDTKNYLWFIDDHWIVKLDIVLPDILLTWYILKWNIKLNIE